MLDQDPWFAARGTTAATLLMRSSTWSLATSHGLVIPPRGTIFPPGVGRIATGNGG
jgi:hypothetical protein